MLNILNNRKIILKIIFSILLTFFCVLFCSPSSRAVTEADMADHNLTVDTYFDYCKSIADSQFGNNNYDYAFLKFPNWDSRYSNSSWKYVFITTPKISDNYDLWIGYFSSTDGYKKYCFNFYNFNNNVWYYNNNNTVLDINYIDGFDGLKSDFTLDTYSYSSYKYDYWKQYLIADGGNRYDITRMAVLPLRITTGYQSVGDLVYQNYWFETFNDNYYDKPLYHDYEPGILKTSFKNFAFNYDNVNFSGPRVIQKVSLGEPEPIFDLNNLWDIVPTYKGSSLFTFWDNKDYWSGIDYKLYYDYKKFGNYINAIYFDGDEEKYNEYFYRPYLKINLVIDGVDYSKELAWDDYPNYKSLIVYNFFSLLASNATPTVLNYWRFFDNNSLLQYVGSNDIDLENFEYSLDYGYRKYNNPNYPNGIGSQLVETVVQDTYTFDFNFRGKVNNNVIDILDTVNGGIIGSIVYKNGSFDRVVVSSDYSYTISDNKTYIIDNESLDIIMTIDNTTGNTVDVMGNETVPSYPDLPTVDNFNNLDFDDLFTGITSSFNSLQQGVNSIGNMFSYVFSWLPPPIPSLIIFIFSAVIIIAIIRFIRGA